MARTPRVDVVDRLRMLGGAARWADLVRTSEDGVRLRRAVLAEAVVRVGRGTYALPGAEPDLVTACAYRARLGCVSAAAFWRLPVLHIPQEPHLSVPRERGGPARRGDPPARVHREAGIPASADDRVPVVPLVHAFARMLLCQPPDHALVTIDSALSRGIVTARDIGSALPASAPAGARRTLALADGRSQSPIESVARHALVQAGLRTEPQVLVPGVGYVDLVVQGRVVVELDGFAYHSGRREYREDRRRDRELVAQGYVVLRFTFEDVMRDPQIVVRAVRAALARLG